MMNTTQEATSKPRATMAYLAYPIDQSNMNEELYAFIMMVKRILHSKVDIIFDPGDGFRVTSGPFGPKGPQIGIINRTAADTADLIVAILPLGTPSIGVPMEVESAARTGKSVLVFSDTNSWMLQYTTPNVQVYPIDQNLDLIDIIRNTPVPFVWSTDDGDEIEESDGRAGFVDFVFGDSRMPLPIQPLEPNAMLPTRAFPDDAGLDLYVLCDTEVPAGKFVDVPCGVAVELPTWAWGFLTGRSSTLRKRGLLVSTAIIDCGYRGELFAGAQNLTNQTVTVARGERIAQLIVMPNLTQFLVPEWYERLQVHNRGVNGFGSSGQ